MAVCVCVGSLGGHAVCQHPDCLQVAIAMTFVAVASAPKRDWSKGNIPDITPPASYRSDEEEEDTVFDIDPHEGNHDKPERVIQARYVSRCMYHVCGRTCETSNRQSKSRVGDLLQPVFAASHWPRSSCLSSHNNQ
jgi:hypothetical protein